MKRRKFDDALYFVAVFALFVWIGAFAVIIWTPGVRIYEYTRDSFEYTLVGKTWLTALLVVIGATILLRVNRIHRENGRDESP